MTPQTSERERLIKEILILTRHNSVYDMEKLADFIIAREKEQQAELTKLRAVAKLSSDYLRWSFPTGDNVAIILRNQLDQALAQLPQASEESELTKLRAVASSMKAFIATAKAMPSGCVMWNSFEQMETALAQLTQAGKKERG